MKVSALDGAYLDYWVARAEGETAVFEYGECKYHYDDEHGTWDENWHPSADWSQGGPIIERERIALIPVIGGTWSAEYDEPTGGGDYQEHAIDGPTALIAAMRAFVASKFGVGACMNDETVIRGRE